jgi:hypothetical protein
LKSNEEKISKYENLYFQFKSHRNLTLHASHVIALKIEKSEKKEFKETCITRSATQKLNLHKFGNVPLH